MVCRSCGTENRAGRKFCAECGAPLAVACPACRAPNEPGERFCGECGARLEGAQPAESGEAGSASERRLVSVLFADLVGFTSLSEQRDSEEVREFLSHYFETARRTIDRFGGTIEKFIGDAVMAVWGTPVAHEDDAERAVRAALDLLPAVAALGAEAGSGGLRARAAVLTGEAAVALDAEGQGMVAGDLVNSASRVQALAEPGTVLVGEATRRSSEAAIAYENVGTHELKGRAEPLPLWRADRVIATRGGGGRSTGLEAPFVGRDAELRLVKDLFHAAADERKARLVSVVGVAGVGKSRLSWEFQKYLDGLVETILWHRGRCLAYGEGVAFWALAEMVRMRAGIAEEEAPGTALEKLKGAIAEYVTDADEAAWLEPRLAHLLGLGEPTSATREDLFSAWRLFFERLAQEGPTVLVFEDLQWADTALLDFVEYLLEWSRSHPLFVLTLARPELADRQPSWGAGKRDFTSLFLEPLPPEAMEELLRGFVPGLPDELRTRIRERAEGIPLYAVETVRMLLDRGLLERDNGAYRPTEAIETLEVPETLHALIAARLDDLASEERRVLGDAAVLGKSFTKRALAALTGTVEDELEPLLAALVRKEILTLQTDPLSPEHGQYAFLQALVQKVAHDTLSRRERKARHLAAAEFFETSWGAEEQEIVEVIASHYLEAYEADTAAADAAAIKAKAREQLAKAGARAASLAAAPEAQRYFDQAAALADDPGAQAELLDHAGEAAEAAGHPDLAVERFREAIALLESQDRPHAVARVSAHLGASLFHLGEIEAGVEQMEQSFTVLSQDEPDDDLAALAAELARQYFFLGNLDRAGERVELALEIAESLWLPDRLADALNTKHLVLMGRGREEEAMALLKHALDVALENDTPAAMRAYTNLGHDMRSLDRYEEARTIDLAGLAHSRKLGNRVSEAYQLHHLALAHYFAGEWDDGIALVEELMDYEIRIAQSVCLIPGAPLRVHRGDVETAQAEVEAWVEAPGDEQERCLYDAARAIVALAGERPADALDAAEAAFGFRDKAHTFAKEGFVVGGEAAFALGKLDRVEAFLAEVRAMPPGLTPPYLRAHSARFAARLAAAQNEHELVEPSFEAAVQAFRDLGLPFYLAIALLEQGEWLIARGRAAEAERRLEEAKAIFERLEARPWLDRFGRAAAPAEEVALG
ncbi:MAG: AAA family ATPase [Gaiellaceae bacterium]